MSDVKYQAKMAEDLIRKWGGNKDVNKPLVSSLNKSPWNVPQGVSGQYNKYRRDALNQQGLGHDVQESRRWEDEGAGMLRGLAQGKDSIVAKQTLLARENAAKRIASQLASARGGYNPAAMRGAQMAQAGAESQLGAQGAINQSMEQQQAMRNYLAAAQGIRGQDLASEQMMRQERLGQQGVAQGWQKIGLSDKYTQAALQQQYEKMRLAREFELLSSGLGFQSGQPQVQAAPTDWGGIMGGAGSLIAGGAMAASAFGG